MRTERRQFGRRNLAITVVVRSDDGRRYRGRLVNISEGGALLEFDRPPNLTYNFSIEIPGVVGLVRCEFRRATEHGLGANFLNRLRSQDIKKLRAGLQQVALS